MRDFNGAANDLLGRDQLIEHAQAQAIPHIGQSVSENEPPSDRRCQLSADEPHRRPRIRHPSLHLGKAVTTLERGDPMVAAQRQRRPPAIACPVIAPTTGHSREYAVMIMSLAGPKVRRRCSRS